MTLTPEMNALFCKWTIAIFFSWMAITGILAFAWERWIRK